MDLIALLAGALVGSASMLVVLRYAVPALVLRAYRRHVPTGRFAAPDRDEGAGTEDVVYQSAVFDCRAHDLVVRGVAPDAPYWMIGAYDRWARPLDGAHLNHHVVRVVNGRFEVRVSRFPAAGRPDWLCVADDPRGLLVFRALCPRGEVAPLTLDVVRDEALAAAS